MVFDLSSTSAQTNLATIGMAGRTRLIALWRNTLKQFNAASLIGVLKLTFAFED